MGRIEQQTSDLALETRARGPPAHPRASSPGPGAHHPCTQCVFPRIASWCWDKSLGQINSKPYVTFRKR